MEEVLVFPPSFAQQRLWFLDQLESNSSTYHGARVIRLIGPLNIVALEQSINELLRRHESLRTTFTLIEEQPVQVVSPPSSLSIPVIDLQEWPHAEREVRAQQLISEAIHRLMNLIHGPLMRTTLLQLDEEEHILLLTMHHIISDGWSMQILFRELSLLYDAFSSGKPSPLPALPIQYADFAVWQRQWLQGEILETHLAYWKQQLHGLPPMLELPTDYPRPAVQTFQGAHHAVKLPLSLLESLKALSSQEQVTLFMTLLTAFKILLCRYAGQDDIVVGSPIAGRTRIEFEGLIGLFVNILVLRTDLAGDPSFRELLQRVRKICLEAYAHQELPFEKLVEELRPERDLSRTPLFQVFFNMLTLAEEQIAWPGLSAKVLPFVDTHSEFDLTLYVQEQHEGLELTLVYNTDLFSPERMRELLAQYQQLLSQIIDHPEQCISSYSLVTSTAKQLLPDPCVVLVEPTQDMVTHVFAQCARQTPDQIAVSQGQHTWTYSELAERMDRLARTLVAHGVSKGDVVAVYGPPSLGLIATMLGVFRSGGVMLPIDPHLPDQRKRVMLQESAVKCLVYVGTTPRAEAWLEQTASLHHLCVDATTGLTPTEERGMDVSTIPPLEVTPDDAAYIFFTSGSTGIPKGILGCHKGLSHFLRWQGETFGIGPQDRVAQLIHLSFDAVLRDIFLPLTRGATLCVPEEQDTLSPQKLLRWLDQERITLVHTIPSLAQAWLAQVPDDVSLHSLRWAFFSGEPLTDTLVRQWHPVFSNSTIVNLYGPTETTLVKCFYQISAEVLPGVQPAGWPLPQTQALVLAEHNRLCGIGEPGEIVLRTPFRTLGYMNAPAEQQKRFVQNPFRDDGQDWFYYTGDQGRYRPDGMLEILGRLDEQVKIRGVRIEPNEITAMLAQHPAIRACVVIASKDAQRQNALVAYVTAKERAQASPGLLHAYLAQHVPAAMIPARFILLDQLPLTPNGKIDRQALPVPDWTVLAVEENFVLPLTPLEEVVAGIWAEALRLEQIGVHDNFFTLGGHSLLATQVISQLRDLFHMEIPLRRLFEQPTVAEFAAMLLHDPLTRRQVEKTAQLLLSLSQLSEAEVESRLEAQSSVSKKRETR